MIIERYLFRELVYSFIGVTLLLTLITVSSTFVRILAEAADGTYPQQLVFTLFVLKSIPNLALVMPLALLLAVLLALGRLYRDSEMVVLAACGVPPRKTVWVATVLSGMVGLLVGVLTLWIAPAAQEESQQLLDRAAAKAEVEGIAAGRFTQSASGEHLIYVESLSGDRRLLENVFAHSRGEQGQVALITAERARQYTDPDTGDRYLILTNGYRYEGRPGEADYRIVQFETHGVRIEERDITPSRRALYSIPTERLWETDDLGQAAELQWRISGAISTMLLGILAVPLARTNPRQGRYGRLFAGIMVFIIYNNLMTVARAWVAKGEVPEPVGMWWVHGVMLALVVWLVRREGRLPASRRLRWRRAAA